MQIWAAPQKLEAADDEVRLRLEAEEAGALEAVPGGSAAVFPALPLALAVAGGVTVLLLACIFGRRCRPRAYSNFDTQTGGQSAAQVEARV